MLSKIFISHDNRVVSCVDIHQHSPQGEYFKWAVDRWREDVTHHVSHSTGCAKMWCSYARPTCNPWCIDREQQFLWKVENVVAWIRISAQLTTARTCRLALCSIRLHGSLEPNIVHNMCSKNKTLIQWRPWFNWYSCRTLCKFATNVWIPQKVSCCSAKLGACLDGSRVR